MSEHRSHATRLVNEGYMGVPKDMCLRCGLIGRHATHEDCITALRNRIALLEFKVVRLGDHSGLAPR